MSDRMVRFAQLEEARLLLKWAVTWKKDASVFKTKAGQARTSRSRKNYLSISEDCAKWAKENRLEAKSVLQEIEKSAGIDYVKGEDHRPSARHLKYQG